jgi:hypothetical protein
MAHEVYYQFRPTPGQARRAGSRGGRAAAVNRRQRQDGAAAPLPQPQAEAAAQFLRETTAGAIALLDAQCPWLRGAEQRFSPRSPRAACSAVVLRSEA